MIKKLFKASLWGVLTLSLFYSCRTDSVTTEQTITSKEKIAAFERFESENNIIKPIASNDRNISSAKYVSYAYPFAQVIYNFLQNHPDYAKKVENEAGTIRLDVVSQTFGQNKKSVIFPVVNNQGEVVGAWAGILNENRDYVSFYYLDNSSSQNVAATKAAFQAYYDKKYGKITNQATASVKGINPIALAPLPPPKVPVQTIQEVVINVPAPDLTVSSSWLTGAGGVNYGNTLGGGMSGGPTTHGGGGSTSQSADQWAKDHIDASALKNNKCADEVYQKLKDNSAFFNNLLGKFDGNAILDLKFDIKDVGYAAITEIENVRNGYVTIALNPNYLGSSELGRASLIIHEMLHAYMTWQLVNSGWDGYNTAESYKSIDEKNLPTLLKAYKEKMYTRPSDSEHEFIANYYIPKIVNALKAYDPNLGTDSEYDAIAWGGLVGTTAFTTLQKIDPDRAATVISLLNDNVKKESCKN
ncbi:hypothetical protein BAX94_00490 [Elizabethkingia meningoseptica]|uniref:Uncharacterized protein n=2 Tax=Elizabethkingia meningoseptica TaxID=238 RepID=A0A1V3U3X4_ELIME|nr:MULTISPECIES: hypothetical protein [Elizabethkingia]AQX12855.1 hypothetical protein BBD35_10945 [Elizabethkingia meningoseptica]MDX8574627.1 hypothetical protein [Elizabethkingia sp. HX WYD]ODM55315.1 hypothetical protein BES09_02375 [Elizabethkingia meningoseptica]OHT30520.1 hypothetical protein BFF93_02380 [Elizabethkingia meningoseptica]OHT32694.1 hypothetical protein BGC12_02240 [Elizabethkingia meningoseptica]